MRHLLFIIFFIFINFNALYAQKDLKLLRDGNKDYKNNQFKEAEINYRKSIQENSRNYKSIYNLANALYKQGNFEEAANLLNDLSDQKLSDDVMSKVYHNLGNALVKNEKYAESIDAYKKSLRLNSKDMDTKYNLSYALSKIQQQQNNSCDNKNEDKKEDKENENNKDDNKNQEKDNNENKKQESPKDELTKEEAEKILNALQSQEQNVKDKADKKAQPVKVIVEKDW